MVLSLSVVTDCSDSCLHRARVLWWCGSYGACTPPGWKLSHWLPMAAYAPTAITAAWELKATHCCNKMPKISVEQLHRVAATHAALYANTASVWLRHQRLPRACMLCMHAERDGACGRGSS